MNHVIWYLFLELGYIRKFVCYCIILGYIRNFIDYLYSVGIHYNIHSIVLSGHYKVLHMMWSTQVVLMLVVFNRLYIFFSNKNV